MKQIKSNILVIERNYAMRLFLHNYLSKEFNVQSFSTFEEAFEDHEMHFFPDALITDYCINEENSGHDLVRKSLFLRNKPMIVLTDQDKSSQRIEALRFGVSDCLSKPFNPVELSVRIKRLTAKKDNTVIERQLQVV